MSSSHKTAKRSVRRSVSLGAAMGMIFALLPFGTAAYAQDTPISTADVCPPPGETASNQFPDDNGSVHESNINCVAQYEIAQGFVDGTYRPAENISRGQMATFIANMVETALGEDLPAGSDAFDDDDGTTHESNINKVANAGIVSGRGGGNYDPGGFVDRAAMATFIAQAIDYSDDEDVNGSEPPAATEDEFPDDTLSTHHDNINRLANQDIIVGKEDGLFHPNELTSRAQMATFIIQGVAYLDTIDEFAPTEGVTAPAEGLNITPTEAAQNNASTAGGNQGSRQYTVTGLDNALTYDIALFPAGNITRNDTDTAWVFKDTTGNANEADDAGNVPNAVIEVVNGVATAAGTKKVEATPSGGTITFTIDSTGFDEVRPVIWQESADNDQLNLNADNTASEPVGVGGQKTWVPAEAADGPFGPDNVVFVDKDENFFVLETAGARFNYEEGDVFQYDTNPTTLAQFESALSVGDDIQGNYSRTFQSTFNMVQDIPGAPQNLQVTVGDFDNDANDTNSDDARFTWDTAPNGLIDSYTVTVYDDDPNTAGCQTTFQRGQVGQTTVDGSARTADVEELANDTYCGIATATSQTGDTGPNSNSVFFTVQVGAADETRPVINDLYLETDSTTFAVIDSGDTIHFDHSESMAIDTTSATFRFEDPDGEIFDVECGAQATCSLTSYTPTGSTTAITNGRLVVFLTADPVKVGGPAPPVGGAGAQVPGTVTAVSSDWDDTAGNQLNLEGSPDRTIDNEF